MSFFNSRGIFLQLLGPTKTDPNEVLVSMQFALKESRWDPVNRKSSDVLLDSTIITASSYDAGRTFKLRNTKDVDRDGDVDADDQDKLLALAKAYTSIINP